MVRVLVPLLSDPLKSVEINFSDKGDTIPGEKSDGTLFEAYTTDILIPGKPPIRLQHDKALFGEDIAAQRYKMDCDEVEKYDLDLRNSLFLGRE